MLFLDTVSGEFEHVGPWNNFNNKGSLTYAPQKTVELSTSFSAKPNMEFSADLKLPSWSGKAVVSHTGTIKSWKNSVAVTIGDSQPISLYSEFDTMNSYMAKVLLFICSLLHIGSSLAQVFNYYSVVDRLQEHAN